MLYKTLILPILQLINPEFSHFVAEKFLQSPFFKYLNPIKYKSKHSNLSHEVMGIEFDSPIGLAAGYDKNCKTLSSLLSLHFGFITGGTITVQPRYGNPKPRLFHVPDEKAIINALGFPSLGLERIRSILQKYEIDDRIFLSVSGINEDEIISCVETLENFTKVFELNISSPNTEGLRIFHNPSELSNLIEKVRSKTKNKILIKLPPWLENEKDTFLKLAQTSIISGADGLVIANSLPIKNNKLALGKGGKSGKVLIQNTLRMIAEARSLIGPDAIIISCGGIFEARDVWNSLALGADLCQAYTGFIYEGPLFAYNINKKLSKLLIENNLKSFNQIKGRPLI